MSLKIPDARKKKRPKMHLKSPLPVPLYSKSEKESQFLRTQTIFQGFFKYGAVIIEDSRFAEVLWENGFFGDGNLSSSGLRYKTNLKVRRNNDRSKAEECQRVKMVYNLNEKEEELVLKITDSSKFQKFQGMGETKNEPRHETVEVLHLCLEEAFFLSYTLGTLVLRDETGSEMDIDTMWTAFRNVDYQFPLQYAVYHHFRCKGWVVKPGTKFGADWVLYPVGPPFYHSQYLVWVQCLWKENLNEDSSLSNRRNDITDLSALERLSGHVGKTMLLCQVLRPSDLSEDELSSVECLRRLVLSEVILQRWMPNAEVSSGFTPDASFPSSSKGEKRPSGVTP